MNPETDEPEEIDFLAELSLHLQPGWVAIIMEAGAEKLRYIAGFAAAVNSKGETREVTIQEIYERAKPLGEHITQAEY